MAEPLPEALGWLDARKRQVVAELATALGAPETIEPNIWGALKDLAKNLDPRVDTTTDDPVQNSRNLMSGFANMLGGIRPGGNPALMMSHGASGLGRPETGLLRELLHPSLAITGHGKLTNPFSSTLLIPREGAFDPAYTTSTLFNRDAYIARAKDYPGGLEPTPRERVLTRELSPPTFSEGKTSFPSWSGNPTSGGHSLVVNASPAFRSLAEYENSPKGAATLIEPSQKGLPEKYSAALQDEYRAWAKRAHPREFDWLVGLRKAAAAGDRDAMQILAKAQRAPSEYAELKVSGPVPLTGERFAGAILPSYTSQWLVDALRGRGITPEKLSVGAQLYSKDAHTLATQLQREAGPVKERPLRVAAGWQAPREFKIEAPPTSLQSSSTQSTLHHAAYAAMEQATKEFTEGMDNPVSFKFKGESFHVTPEGDVHQNGQPSDMPLLTLLDQDGMPIPPGKAPELSPAQEPIQDLAAWMKENQGDTWATKTAPAVSNGDKIASVGLKTAAAELHKFTKSKPYDSKLWPKYWDTGEGSFVQYSTGNVYPTEVYGKPPPEGTPPAFKVGE